jgi:thiamine pyrophosphate-dependent acetolactate synthase large subunit-like protein
VRCPIKVGLLGDSKATLQGLIPLLKKKSNNNFLSKLQKSHEKAILALDKKAELKKTGKIASPVVTRVISDLLEDDAIVTVDAGTVSVWANNWLRLNGRQRLIGSTELGTLGFGMPAAIGCQIAEPSKQVVALCGDGGFQMTLGDLSTAVKYQLPITVVIFNNFAYHFIELEQLKEGVAQCYTKLNNPDYAKMADAFGAKGYSVKKSCELESALASALSEKVVSVVDVHVDPNELIMPTKLTTSMILMTAESMVKTHFSKKKNT